MLVYFPYRNAIETAHFTKSDEEPTLVKNSPRTSGWTHIL